MKKPKNSSVRLRKHIANFGGGSMEDKEVIQNWTKVKEALEEAGKTDCWFYRRACAVVETGKDPGLPKLST